MARKGRGFVPLVLEGGKSHRPSRRNGRQPKRSQEDLLLREGNTRSKPPDIECAKLAPRFAPAPETPQNEFGVPPVSCRPNSWDGHPPSTRNGQRIKDEPIDKNGDSKPKKKESHHEPKFLHCLAHKRHHDIE